MIEEAIDDAGAMQQRRWLALRAPFAKPRLQRFPVDSPALRSNRLEVVKDLSVDGASMGSEP